MDNAMLVGMQTQRVLQRRLDITAGNLANVSTHGFKADALIFNSVAERDARTEDPTRYVTFVRDVAIARDMSQGALENTDNPLDVAIEGDGFFAVQTPAGIAYTRDGGFKTGPGGQLLSRDGYPVLNPGGEPIVFDTQGQRPSIAADGAIRVGENLLAQLQVVTFPRPTALVKLGDNLFNAEGQEPGPFTGEVVQGALEQSNVKPVVELTRLIEISRAYESASRFSRQGDDLRSRAIERLGRG